MTRVCLVYLVEEVCLVYLAEEVYLVGTGQTRRTRKTG